MSRFALVLLAAGFAACASSSTLETTAGPFHVTARFTPDPPRAGDNVLTLGLTDAAGDPVRDAEIGVVATMPAMGAMPEMRAPGTVTALGHGTYRVELELAMTGAWPLELAVRTPDGRSARVAFDYKTGIPVRLARNAAPRNVPDADAAQAAATGAIHVDDRQRQLVGVKTKRIERTPTELSIRAFGRVAYDESRLTDVALKFPGFVGEVFADSTWISVRAGEPLLTVYGPELLSAQQEYLETLRRGAGGLAEIARQRLLLWNLGAEQIAELARTARPVTYVPIASPATGTVIEKHVVDGSAFEQGERLYRIADLSAVWILADAYEADLPLLAKGQPVSVTLPYLPGTELSAHVDYVYPGVDPQTRTGRVRIVVPNPELLLKPEMYADVELSVPLGEQIVVPEEAVIRSGKRNVVFLDEGDGLLAPKTIEVGRRTPDGYVVLSGLAPGDVVVTSGTFLIASESKLRAGIERW